MNDDENYIFPKITLDIEVDETVQKLLNGDKTLYEKCYNDGGIIIESINFKLDDIKHNILVRYCFAEYDDYDGGWLDVTIWENGSEIYCADAIYTSGDSEEMELDNIVFVVNLIFKQY